MRVRFLPVKNFDRRTNLDFPPPHSCTMAGKKGGADGMKKWAGLLLAFLLWLGATTSAAVQLGDRAEDTVSTVEARKQTLGLTTLPMGTGGLDAFLAYEQPGIPFSVLIDADGTVRAMHLGVATAEGRLDALDDIR